MSARTAETDGLVQPRVARRSGRSARSEEPRGLRPGSRDQRSEAEGQRALVLRDTMPGLARDPFVRDDRRAGPVLLPCRAAVPRGDPGQRAGRGRHRARARWGRVSGALPRRPGGNRVHLRMRSDRGPQRSFRPELSQARSAGPRLLHDESIHPHPSAPAPGRRVQVPEADRSRRALRGSHGVRARPQEPVRRVHHLPHVRENGPLRQRQPGIPAVPGSRWGNPGSSTRGHGRGPARASTERETSWTSVAART